MNRRDFFKKTLTTGTALGFYMLSSKNRLSAVSGDQKNNGLPDLVAVKGGSPEAMFDAAIKAYGGIGYFVKKGATVVVKPNIGWNRSPEEGANTNPRLVARIIEHCLNAGAKKVYVLDHTCDDWVKTYKNSGIESAVNNAGGQMVPASSERYYHPVKIPGASILREAMVHELIINADVLINVPILKHHSGSRLTIAMKNLMGIVWDRGFYHSNNLQQTIAEFCGYCKPTLNVIDAYAVMLKNGPRGVSTNDIDIRKNLLISTDIVAADAAAAKIFGVEPNSVPYITYAHKKKIGNMLLDQLNIKRLTV